MKISISFKNLEHTEALDEKIKEKTERLSKFFDGNISVHWVCHVDGPSHCADMKLSGPTFTFNASAKSETMYKTLDLVMDKIEKQLQKRKETWKDHAKDKEALNDLPSYGEQYVEKMFEQK